MKDALCTFDNKASLLSAQFGAGAIGSYTSNFSYDTAGGATAVDVRGAGTLTAIGPGGAIGGPLLHDFGRGRRLNFNAQITTAVTSAGAAAVQVNFVSADDGPLATNLTVLLQSAAIGKAALLPGYRFRHGSTPGVISQRFVGAQVIISVAALTSGAYSADMTTDTDDHADVLG